MLRFIEKLSWSQWNWGLLLLKLNTVHKKEAPYIVSLIQRLLNLKIYLACKEHSSSRLTIFISEAFVTAIFLYHRDKETALSNPALLVCDILTLTAGEDVRQHIRSSMMRIYRWLTRQELWVLWLWRSETGTQRRKRLNSRWEILYKYKHTLVRLHAPFTMV